MDGGTEAASKGLEHPLDEMMVIIPTCADVKVATQCRTQRIEEVSEHLGWRVAHIFTGEEYGRFSATPSKKKDE